MAAAHLAERNLAPWAVTSHASPGRQHSEAPTGERSEFQRDRDRIVHSSAYRRLQYKTQVFINHEGDLFRTRLTHTLEVAQIARSLARSLRLNEDLTEAIAIAHDLGHTPFGHAGQDALHACMKDHGGFEHNLQSLRVVDILEERYGAFDGLNLMFETRAGILKHCSLANARKLGPVAARFLKKQQPHLEAQLCNLADELAYNTHDVDDGLRSGLLTLEGLSSIALFAEQDQEVHRLYPNISGRRHVYEVVRRMINAQCMDILAQTRANLAAHQPASPDAVRLLPPLVTFSPAMAQRMAQLRSYLRHHLYAHYRVLRMTHKAKQVISQLFAVFCDNANLLPPDYQRRAAQDRQRAVADYIAGMTDRFAIREYRRLFTIEEVQM